MKIAEALLLRKHLANKVKQLEPLKMNGDKGLFEVKTQRKSISDNVDELLIQAPKVTLKDVTAEYDLYASEFRKLDASIQEANWTHSVTYKQPDAIK